MRIINLFKKTHFSKGICFTFVEILLVLAIVGILTGLILPPLTRSRNKDRFNKWLKYSTALSQSPDTVVNFNFQKSGYKININGVMTPCVENSATACGFKGFDIKEYAGIMLNNPEWLPHGGRWYEKSAMQFNGSDQCLYIPGRSAVDFLRTKDNFTIYLWIYYYSKPSQTVFTKGEDGAKQQYKMSMHDSKPQVIIGTKKLRCKEKIDAGKWYHIAVVNKAGSSIKIFINGQARETENIKTGLGVDQKNGKSLTIGASAKLKTRKIYNSRTGKTDEENYYSLRECFRGKIDEIVILRRAMSDKEVETAYETGRAY